MGRLTLLGTLREPKPQGDDRHIDADVARSLKDRVNVPEVKPNHIKPRTGAVIGEIDETN